MSVYDYGDTEGVGDASRLYPSQAAYSWRQYRPRAGGMPFAFDGLRSAMPMVGAPVHLVHPDGSVNLLRIIRTSVDADTGVMRIAVG